MSLKMEWEYKTLRVPKNFNDKMLIAETIRKMQRSGWELVLDENKEPAVANLTKDDKVNLLVFKKAIPKWY